MNSKKQTLLFSILVLGIIGLRYYVLVHFGFKYSDSDQAIMWNALRNYSEGEFHEPRFYGQAYNSMLEAFLAIPLYKMGVPCYKALPIVTTFISLFPFFLISFFTLRFKSTFISLIILSIPLLMPINYHLITTLPRGFVTGIFIASFGIISIFYLKKKWAFFLLGFCSVIGYSINANSVILSLPCLLYVFLWNRKNITFYIYSGIAIVLGGMLHFWTNHFYVSNANYNLHKFELKYSFDLLIKNMGNLDPFFNDLSPLFWNQGFIWIIIALLTGIVLIWKRKIQYGILFLSIPILLILPLGINKVNDSTNSIFFSISRMYLSLPILIAVCLTFINKLKPNYYYIIIPFLLLWYNAAHIDSVINDKFGPNIKHIVSVAKVDSVLELCKNINRLCSINDIDLVVVVRHGNQDFINYGCPACLTDFPKTIRPSYERRTWRLLEDEKNTYSNILFIDSENQLNQEFDFIEQIEFHENIFIVKNNQLTTMKLFNKMNLKIRNYK